MCIKNQNHGPRSWSRTAIAFVLGVLVGFVAGVVVAGVVGVLVLMIVLQAVTSYAG
jgi:hypothetical protein